MSRLFVMCGLQGSGKTTIANNLAVDRCLHNMFVLSSDEIRKEFPNAKNEKIFKILYERMNDLLYKNKDVVVDATNTTIKARKNLLSNIKHECHKTCLIVNTPYELCLERVRNRNKKKDSHFVPEEVVEMYYRSFEIPFYEEGWNSIELHYQPEYFKSNVYMDELLERAKTFNQNNKHHTQLLGDHMETACKYLENKVCSANVIKACKYHDIGKMFTQTYKKGDPNAHYYDHANVGAYELMCFGGIFDKEWRMFNLRSTLEWLFYINYHMKMHDIKTEKAIKKWKSIFGEFKFDGLKLLNEADCFRGEVTQTENKKKVYDIDDAKVKLYYDVSQPVTIGKPISPGPYITVVDDDAVLDYNPFPQWYYETMPIREEE